MLLPKTYLYLLGSHEHITEWFTTALSCTTNSFWSLLCSASLDSCNSGQCCKISCRCDIKPSTKTSRRLNTRSNGGFAIKNMLVFVAKMLVLTCFNHSKLGCTWLYHVPPAKMVVKSSNSRATGLLCYLAHSMMLIIYTSSLMLRSILYHLNLSFGTSVSRSKTASTPLKRSFSVPFRTPNAQQPLPVFPCKWFLDQFWIILWTC